MKVKILKSGLWYRQGEEYDVRSMEGVKQRNGKRDSKDLMRLPAGYDRRAGVWYVEDILFNKCRFIRRVDCEWVGVKEYGKSDKYLASEMKLQKATMDYLKLVKLNAIHVPNEGKRSRKQGRRLKNEGMRPGFPDVLIFKSINYQCERIRYVGCAIELKVDGGRVDDLQVEELQKLYYEGWKCGVCWSLDGVREMVNEFLK